MLIDITTHQFENGDYLKLIQMNMYLLTKKILYAPLGLMINTNGQRKHFVILIPVEKMIGQIARENFNDSL